MTTRGKVLSRLPHMALMLAMSLACGHAQAQAWPAKPIRIVVANPPGGITDVLSRVLGQKMTEDLKQQVLTDNRGGAGNVRASDLVAQAPADGYTVLLCTVALAVNPALMTELPYDTVRDFTPISLIGGTPLVLAINASVKANNAKEFIALARAQPGKLFYSSAGVGSGGHLAFELLKSMAGVDIGHVPYKGGAPAAAALGGGQVQAEITNEQTVDGMAKAGRLRLLAVTSKQRSPQFPDLPTIAESGLPGYESLAWFGIVGPRGLPRDVVMRLNASIRQAILAPDTKERLEKSGFDAQTSTPEEFTAYLASEMTKWKAVVQKANIKPE